jgi:hypothetical protein
MHREKGPYFVGGGGFAGPDIEPDVIAGSDPPPEQPGLWCQWVPSEDGSAIGWDEEEKFYDAERWLAYLVDTFLAPDATLARELADPVPARVYPEDFRALHLRPRRPARRDLTRNAGRTSGAPSRPPALTG